MCICGCGSTKSYRKSIANLRIFGCRIEFKFAVPSSVDHTLAIFHHKAEADEFLTKLNCLHPSLKFTFEKEKGKCLTFLDVYVKRTDIGFETSVYRKPTSTDLFLHCESFSPLKRKISLISTLMQSSPNNLHQA